MYMRFCALVVLAYNLCDVNYFLRTLFTVFVARLDTRSYSLTDTTTLYGVSTFQDANICLRRPRLDRIIRDLDFARYHFYFLTKVYQRSVENNIKGIQGCTFTITFEPMPLFVPYKITTKLVFWDEKSLFFEHKLVTLHDGKVRHFLVSRQHALGEEGVSASAVLLNGLRGSDYKPECPEYIDSWLRSMTIKSNKLRFLPTPS